MLKAEMWAIKWTPPYERPGGLTSVFGWTRREVIKRAIYLNDATWKRLYQGGMRAVRVRVEEIGK